MLHVCVWRVCVCVCALFFVGGGVRLVCALLRHAHANAHTVAHHHTTATHTPQLQVVPEVQVGEGKVSGAWAPPSGKCGGRSGADMRARALTGTHIEPVVTHAHAHITHLYATYAPTPAPVRDTVTTVQRRRRRRYRESVA